MLGAIGGIIGGLGGLFGGDDSDTVTTVNEPWAGVQPYLTGEGQVSWAGMPPLNLDWMRYNQALAEGQEGAWDRTPPPMIINDPRLTGEGVYQPANPGGILGVDEWGSLRPPGDSPVPIVDGPVYPDIPPPPGIGPAAEAGPTYWNPGFMGQPMPQDRYAGVLDYLFQER